MEDFDGVYQRYFPQVYRYLCALCRDSGLAEELAQETFVQALEHLNEATQSLSQFSESIFTYVDNNHTPFTIDQVDDLKEVHTALIKLLDEYCKMLQTGTYIQFDYTMVAQEQLLQLVAKATKRQIKRAQRNQTRTRSSLLYLNMLNEMRFMAVQVRALTNDERNFVAA